VERSAAVEGNKRGPATGGASFWLSSPDGAFYPIFAMIPRIWSSSKARIVTDRMLPVAAI